MTNNTNISLFKQDAIKYLNNAIAKQYADIDELIRIRNKYKLTESEANKIYKQIRIEYLNEVII